MFIQMIGEQDISLLAIECVQRISDKESGKLTFCASWDSESHCVSEWGTLLESCDRRDSPAD
jgi:hypothetical protein